MDRQKWATEFYSRYFTKLEPNEQGECQVLCPWHDDEVESMSINLKTGQFYCHACDIGGDEYEFYRVMEGYEKKEFAKMVKELEEELGKRPQTQKEQEGKQVQVDDEIPDEYIPEKTIRKFQKILLDSPKMQQFLLNKRGLTRETLEKYQLGYDVERITIPVYDRHGGCVNIRRYAPEQKGKAKMISYKHGSGAARLYPIENLQEKEVMLVEGEMDALLANQMGYNAITSTGGASTWRKHWSQWFEGKRVRICYDIDKAGQQGAEKVAQELHEYAEEIKIIKLPILDPPDGDITDFFVALGHSKEDLDAIIEKTPVFRPEKVQETEESGEAKRVHLSQASHSDYIGKRIEMDVIVSGKDTAPYGYPKQITINCTPDGKTCAACAVGMMGGEASIGFKDEDRILLELIDCSDAQQKGVIKKRAGIPKNCSAFAKQVQEKGNLEEVMLQPELDFSTATREYTTRVAYVVGHGLQANQSYNMKGVTVTDPRNQYVTHLISHAEPSQDSIATFEMTPQKFERLKAFQPKEGQTVRDKFQEIHNDLENNVTHIYGRQDIMTAVDLVYHSVLAFRFQDQFIKRGWIEALIIGDTRTGKSETAQTMMNHYKLGEFVTGENTSFAGLIGGMQQIQKRWYVSWGKIPINDRRLVIIDEASGLTEDSIANMSGVRSDGVAEIMKIHQERTHARTRLLWVSNTRDGKALSQYSYGVEAIQQLIGKNEDVARFEFAVSCASEEVSMDLINRKATEIGRVPHVYTFDLCKQLVLWAWSRTEEQIHFEDDAIDAILQEAKKMAKEYTSQVPLVEGANQRIKLARMAVAVACRTFSTDDGERVLVKQEHVQFACDYLREVYGKQSLGYYDLSYQIRQQEKMAEDAQESINKFLEQNPDVAKVFLMNNYINAKDLEDMCDLDSATVRRYLKFLAKNGMISKGSRGYTKQPMFIKILRNGRWGSDEGN